MKLYVTLTWFSGAFILFLIVLLCLLIINISNIFSYFLVVILGLVIIFLIYLLFISVFMYWFLSVNIFENTEKIASAEWDKRIEENPDDAYAYIQREIIRTRWANRKGAMEDSTQVIKIVSANSEKFPNINLGFMYFARGQSYIICGDVYSDEKNLESAEFCYKQAIDDFQNCLQIFSKYYSFYKDSLEFINKDQKKLLSIAYN